MWLVAWTWAISAWSTGLPAAELGAAGGWYFRGGPERSGWAGGTAPRSLSPAWSYFAEDDRHAMVLSSPIVRDGKVYGASCLFDPPGSSGAIFRVDLASGRQDWLAPLESNGKSFGYFSSPALSADGTRLLIGQGLHLDFGASLVCLDAATGAVQWTVPTPLHIEGSPAVEGDLVVVGAGAVEQGWERRPKGDPAGPGHPGFVMGVRVSTGALVFRHTVIDPESSPVLADGICYIGSGLNGARAVAIRASLDDVTLAAKGLQRELWSTHTPYPASGDVTLSGGIVLIGCGRGDFAKADADPVGVVVALDAKTGQRRWQVRLPDTVLAPIAVSGRVAVVSCRNGEIVALDLRKSGAVLWRVKPSTTAPVLAGVAFTGELVYAVTSDGYLHILEAKDGTLLDRVYLNAQDRPGEQGLSISSPWVGDGYVVVGSETGGLRMFRNR